MAKTCPGCGGIMEYDPSFDSLVCSTCGNIIDPSTLPDSDDFYHSTDGPVDIEETLQEFEELTSEMFDMHVYKCSQCGGEVLVSDTEISTKCVYCGATAVVFSRIMQNQRPDKIVPFAVTKEEAIESLESNLKSGLFIPKAFKKIPPECVRGIYIPYYTYDGMITDTQHHEWRLPMNDSCVLEGTAEFENLLVECCTALDDRTTALLEPYNLQAAVDFDTSYLMGFYSNVQDSNVREGLRKAELKARTIFHARMREQSPKRPFKQIHSLPTINLHRTAYVLLPAWFITINSKGTPYTFLVNGQTGKTSGTAPWNQTAFFAGIIGASAAICAGLTVLRSTVVHDYIYGLSAWDFAEKLELGSISFNNKLRILLTALILLAIPLSVFAIKQLRRLLAKRVRAGSAATHSFSRRRQGGVK